MLRRTPLGRQWLLVQSGWARQLVGHGSLYSIGTVAQMVGALAALPIATRLLSPTEYGTVVTALLVGQILGAPAAAGMPAAAGRIFFEPDRGPTDAQRLYAAVPVTAGAVVALALATGPFWVPKITGQPMTAAVVLGILAALPLAAFGTSQSLLLSGRRSALYGGYAALSTVGAQAAGLLTVAVTGGGPAQYMGGALVVIVVATVVSGRSARVRPVARLPRPLLREAGSLGLPTVPHLLALQVIGGGDRAVISHFGDFAAVGRYQVAYAVGSIGIALFGAFTQALAPLIQAADDDDRWPLLASTSALLHRLAGCVVAIVALMSTVVLAFAAPASYGRHSLGVVAAIIALTALAYVGYAGPVQVLFETKRPRSLAFITPAVAAGNIAVNLMVVPAFGIRGAAVVTVFTYLAQGGLVWWFARRLADVPWDWRAFVESWAMGAGAVGLAIVLPDGPLGLAVRGVLALTCAAMALRWLARLLLVRAVEAP